MPDTEEIEFTVNESTRAILKALGNDMADKAMEEFFDLWQSEGDPRRAGSIMAHRFVRLGARFAVFGTICAGKRPNIDLWMDVCRERAVEAIKEADIAFEIAETTGIDA